MWSEDNGGSSFWGIVNFTMTDFTILKQKGSIVCPLMHQPGKRRHTRITFAGAPSCGSLSKITGRPTFHRYALIRLMDTGLSAYIHMTNTQEECVRLLQYDTELFMVMVVSFLFFLDSRLFDLRGRKAGSQ